MLMSKRYPKSVQNVEGLEESRPKSPTRCLFLTKNKSTLIPMKQKVTLYAEGVEAEKSAVLISTGVAQPGL